MVCPYASCLDCSICHSSGTHPGPDLVGGGGGGCVLLVQPTPTCTDTTCAGVFPSINWHKYSTCTCCDGHLLQLEHPQTSWNADTAELAYRVVSRPFLPDVRRHHIKMERRKRVGYASIVYMYQLRTSLPYCIYVSAMDLPTVLYIRISYGPPYRTVYTYQLRTSLPYCIYVSATDLPTVLYIRISYGPPYRTVYTYQLWTSLPYCI